MFGFHGALAVTAMLNWNVPCDLPLQWFLLLFGLAGLAGSVAYFVLEVVFDREQLPGVPDPRRGGRTPKLVVSSLLLLTIGLGLFGVVLLSSGPSSSCHVTSPIVYKWAYAASLAFSIFGSLLVLVPLLSIAMPFVAVLLMPIVACLATCAQWMDAAGRRGPFGASGSLHRLLRLAPEEETPMLGTTSNFALYVNTTALCWFFVYLLIEVKRNWLLSCDAPLHAFVGAVAVLGLAISLVDFLHDVFKARRRRNRTIRRRSSSPAPAAAAAHLNPHASLPCLAPSWWASPLASLRVPSRPTPPHAAPLLARAPPPDAPPPSPQDPMPPLTKAEQSSAMGWRRSRLAALGWLLGGILLWGGLGLLWLQGSTTCAHTAPAIYRLALLLSVAFVVLVALMLVILLLLLVDFCCSGRLHLYVVFDK